MAFAVDPTTGERQGWLARVGGGRAGAALRSYRSSAIHRAGTEWVQAELGVGKIGAKMGAWKWLGRGFVGLSAYEGYQQGGLGGALTSTATHLGSTYALGAGLKALGTVGAGIIGAGKAIGAVGAIGIGLGAAVGYAATGTTPWEFLARPAVRERMRKHAKLEMARPVHDQFGTLATMRQRSVMAMQRSHINGRSALGSEATLMYTPYFR